MAFPEIQPASAGRYRLVPRSRRREGPAAVLDRGQRGRRQVARSSAGCSTIPRASTKTRSRPSSKRTVNHSAGAIDLALLTDGLRAEREQGITIDVAYRYFSTPQAQVHHRRYAGPRAVHAQHGHRRLHREPGHHAGGRAQRRAAAVAPPRVHRLAAGHPAHRGGGQQDGPGRLQRRGLRTDLRAISPILPRSCRLPICTSSRSARCTATTSSRRARTCPGSTAPSLLHYLETVHIASDRNLTEFRFPVQYVVRPDQDFRGYAGQVASGVIEPGDPVMVLPSGRTTRVKSIVTYDGELDAAPFRRCR